MKARIFAKSGGEVQAPQVKVAETPCVRLLTVR
jgi:hypothetical protein